MLAFIAGKFDMTFPTDVTVPLLKDIKKRCAEGAMHACGRPGVSYQPDHQPRRSRRSTIRGSARALALTLDRKAFIDILSEGQEHDRRRDAAAAGRRLGRGRRDAEDDLPGYGDDREEPREKARALMKRGRLRAGQAR